MQQGSGAAIDGTRDSGDGCGGCLVTPSDRVWVAPGLIQAAIEALGRDDLDAARRRVMDVDRHYWFSAGVEWATRHQPAAHLSGSARPEQPNAATKRRVFDRDGWRCQYCGLRVVHRECLKLLSRMIPAELPWGDRNGNSHPAGHRLGSYAGPRRPSESWWQPRCRAPCDVLRYVPIPGRNSASVSLRGPCPRRATR